VWVNAAPQRSRFTYGHCHNAEDPGRIILALRLEIANSGRPDELTYRGLSRLRSAGSFTAWIAISQCFVRLIIHL
jgi:hypothetical protein